MTIGALMPYIRVGHVWSTGAVFLMGRFVSFLASLLMSATAFGANSPEPLGYYDLDALGIPKFVNVNYIDVAKISQISKFRSSAGHDYHDDLESCRSMKHYFIAPDASTVITSPVAGTVTRLEKDFAGTQVHITSDLQLAFVFIMFHVNLDKPLTVGDKITEGQRLGVHVGTQTFSDIAVAVNTPKAYRLISYFDTLTDAAFEVFQARGIATRAQLSFSRAERDADPYRCAGEDFAGLKSDPKNDYVSLTGKQNIPYVTLPHEMSLADSGLELSATATSGLPVIIRGGDSCSVIDNKLILNSVGQCVVFYDQPGNATYLPAVQLQYRINVLAAPPDVVMGSVFSSAQSGAQSYVRFSNTGTSADTVKVTLTAGTTGQALGTWTSPSIPAGSSAQVSIATIESVIAPGVAKPQFYTLAVQTLMRGNVQHVLWRPADGTLTNLSTCDSTATINRLQVVNVHSSLLQTAYPSTVVVTNTSEIPSAVQLGIFDSTSGARLGTFTTAPIPGNAQLSVAIPVLEAGATIAPQQISPPVYHYNIQAEGAFSGYLQHLVNNMQAGVTTDMTTVCPLRPVAQSTVATRVGSVYSTAQANLQSYIRIYNQGEVRDGKATLTLADSATGKVLGQWTSPPIFTGASRQFPISLIESEAGITGPKPATYIVNIQSKFGLGGGFLQHVLWRPSDGTLTNLSTCDDGVTVLPARLVNIHSNLLTSNYPSTMVVTNRSNAAKPFVLRVADALTGTFYGRLSVAAVPALAITMVAPETLEAAAPFILTTKTYHYDIIEETSFTSYDRAYPFFLQHLVTNKLVGVITDMTTMCRMN
jgi:hypothetical protein